MGSVLGFPGVDPTDALIGARLKRWREDRGVDISVLAGCMELSAEEVRRAEAGRAHLNSVHIAAATACLHLPVWALVSDERAY